MWHALKYSLRILWKNRRYSIVSLLGLSVGLACCLLVGLYIVDELSYDQFHVKKDRLYRLSTKGRNITAGLTGFKVGPTLAEENSNIEGYCRLLNYGRRVQVNYQENSSYENGIFYSDPSFLDVFSYNEVLGSVTQALSTEGLVVISTSMANKYFGSLDVIGEEIFLDKHPFIVGAIIEDAPSNSDIQYNALVSMKSLNPQWAQVFGQDWFRIVCFTYLLFDEEQNPASLQASLDAFGEKHIRPWAEKNGSTEMYYYQAVPIEEVHFDNSNEFDSPKGKKAYLYIFGLISLFLLLIACINFINLSLAQASARAKEIGVRKSLGASKNAVRLQFFIETLLLTLTAFFFALVLVEIALPKFNELANKSFDIDRLLGLETLRISLILVLTVALLSASYPALILASFQPVQVLKGAMPKIGSVGFVRKVLVVLQFAFAISMMLGTMVVYGQMDFMKNKDLGFSQEQVYVFRLPSDSLFQEQLPELISEYESLGTVSSLSLSSNVPGQGYGELMVRIERKDSLEEATMRYMAIDEHYIPTMGLELIQGRNFIADSAFDAKTAFIINKKTAEVYGWGNDAIGKRIQIGLLADNQATINGRVVGVVKDFNYESLHHPIEPLAIQFISNFKAYLSVKIDGKYDKTAKKMAYLWKEFFPKLMPEGFWLNHEFAKQYQAERNLLSIFAFFAGLSLTISVLGLYALSSFMIRLRTKEIGVRKVLGANYLDIVKIISSEFLRLISTAFIIALPLSFYFLSRWLDGFAYAINFQFAYIILTAFIALSLTAIIIVYHARRVSFSNPIFELRYQ